MAIARFELVSGPDNIIEYKENSTSQTFLRGDIITLTTNLVTDVLEAPIDETGVFGVALKDKTGVDATLIPVQVISGNQVWRAFASASAKPTAYTIGTDYEVDQSAAGLGFIATTTTTTCVVIYKHEAEGKDGTTNGDPMLVKFEASERHMETGDTA